MRANPHVNGVNIYSDLPTVNANATRSGCTLDREALDVLASKYQQALRTHPLNTQSRPVAALPYDEPALFARFEG